MSIPEANLYLPHPEGDGLLMPHAYDYIFLRHAPVIEKLPHVPYEDLGPIVGDIFTAGVAYLANRSSDEYLKQVGTATWRSVNQGRTFVRMSDDMYQVALHMGASLVEAAAIAEHNDEPHIFFRVEKFREGNRLVPYIVLPPDLIERASNRPVEALATTAWIGSHIRDFENERLLIDPENIALRATATGAHLLHQARKLHPDLILPSPYSIALKMFPDGIQSLPSEVSYFNPKSN